MYRYIDTESVFLFPNIQIWYNWNMPKINKTLANPHGLTYKQQATIEIATEQLKNGEKFDLITAHDQIYNSKSRAVSSVQKTQNLQKPNFREALMESLVKKNILGKDGKVETRLMEGLDAYTPTKYGDVDDFQTRLAYIKELNKIVGAYAPTESTTKSVNINANLSEDEADALIQKLSNQLDN